MNLLTFILIQSSIVSAVVDYVERKDEMICIPNASFHIDCNRCRCSPSGMSMDCTDWSCAVTRIAHDLLLNLTVSCKPLEIYFHNHMKCLCSESGRNAACSSAQYELAHELQPASGSIRTTAETIEQCTPGMLFKSGCNTCICGDAATASCLELGCLNLLEGFAQADYNYSSDSIKKICVPNSTFSIDCNQCVCSSDGLSFLCDKYPCLGVEIRDDQMLNITFLCKPDSGFLYNQYECLCSSSGKNALCATVQEDKTLEYCRAGKKVFSIADFPDICTPGMIFKEMCNICVCGSNETAACTKTNCDLGWSTKTSSPLDNRRQEVPLKKIWLQKKRNSRFCRKNPVSLYCRYLKSYRFL